MNYNLNKDKLCPGCYNNCYIIGPTGPKGPTGPAGGNVSVLGTYDTYDDLIKEHPQGKPNDSYLVDGNLYVWSDNEQDWTNIGNIKGPKGDKGDPGPQGLNGEDGISEKIVIEKVETIEPDEKAKIQDRFENNTHNLTFYIPKGEKGNKIQTANIVTFNALDDPDGIAISTNSRLPIDRKELDTDNIVTLNTNEKTMKFNKVGTYKITFTVSAKVKTNTNFDSKEDFATIALRQLNTDNIYVGSSKWIYDEEFNQITGSGILSINNINNTYELVNLSPKTIYLNTPDLKYIKSNSYFTNILVNLIIEYIEN